MQHMDATTLLVSPLLLLRYGTQNDDPGNGRWLVKMKDSEDFLFYESLDTRQLLLCLSGVEFSYDTGAKSAIFSKKFIHVLMSFVSQCLKIKKNVSFKSIWKA